MTLAIEMSRHDEKLVETADPSKRNNLTMMMARTAAEIGISITLPIATMTKRKALTAMTMIQLHEEQREAVAAAESHRRTLGAKDVTPHHPHQASPMAVAMAVAAQPGHAAPEKIRRITSPTMRVPT
jgi:hypothetical protein